jgi:hypothetical protein
MEILVDRPMAPRVHVNHEGSLKDGEGRNVLCALLGALWVHLDLGGRLDCLFS